MTTPPDNLIQGPPPNNYPGASKQSEPQKNTLGLIAIIAAALGFIFACIPGALIVGWILLPVAFILGIVGVCLSNKKKGTSIAAIIVSVVGTIVGFVVFFAVVGNAVDEAVNESFGGGDISVSGPEDGAHAQPALDAGESDDSGDASQGTRQNPYPVGSTISDGDWDVTINSVTLNADGAIANENPINDPPAAGNQFLMTNVTATYTGDDPQGKTPGLIIAYVTADGHTVNMWDGMVVAPDRFQSAQTLYGGASTTGNYVFEVPSASAADGTLAVQATPLSDKTFVAVE